VYPVTATGVEIPDGGTSNFNATSIGSCMYFTVNQNDDLTVIAQFTDGSVTVLFSGKSP
jgi:hypothetical protein